MILQLQLCFAKQKTLLETMKILNMHYVLTLTFHKDTQVWLSIKALNFHLIYNHLGYLSKFPSSCITNHSYIKHIHFIVLIYPVQVKTVFVHFQSNRCCYSWILHLSRIMFKCLPIFSFWNFSKYSIFLNETYFRSCLGLNNDY